MERFVLLLLDVGQAAGAGGAGGQHCINHREGGRPDNPDIFFLSVFY